MSLHNKQTNNYHFIEHFDILYRGIVAWFMFIPSLAAVVASLSNCFCVVLPFLFRVQSRARSCTTNWIIIILYIFKAAHCICSGWFCEYDAGNSIIFHYRYNTFESCSNFKNLHAEFHSYLVLQLSVKPACLCMCAW